MKNKKIIKTKFSEKIGLHINIPIKQNEKLEKFCFLHKKTKTEAIISLINNINIINK